MKKMFLKKHDLLQGYYPFKESQTANFMLQDLQRMLNFEHYYAFSWEYLHLTLTKNNTILLWDSSYIKQKAMDISFSTQEEKQEFDAAYSQYSVKRWNDMPKLELSTQNYHMLVDKWKEFKQLKPIYVIFFHDEKTNFVDIESKDVLSQQDFDDMKKEHEIFLKYQKAWDTYDRSHPNRSEIWRSPADDEYEERWQQYLDKE